MDLTVSLAGLPISLVCRHAYTMQACRDYRVQAAALFSAEVTEEEIAGECGKCEGGAPAGYGEFICLYRRIAGQLPRYGRAVVHGAAITYDGAGLLFMAPSGTGKSTHIRLWKQVFGSHVDMINGDKPILSVEESGVSVHGTPWAGKEGWQKNRSAPLKAICLLSRGRENRIRKADPQAHLPRLMRQLYLPDEPQALQQTLGLLDRLISQVPVYTLECNISPEAAEAAHRGMMEDMI